jgi:predicted TIM-barrel fold metal-dependent hydrolase
MADRILDIHSHIYPRWYIDLLKERTEIPRVVGEEGDERFVIFPSETAKTGPEASSPAAGGRLMDASYWDLGEKLAFMERFGIERTVLSLGNPWLDALNAKPGLAAARRANAEFGELERETGGRVIGMGVLPPGAVADAVAVASEIAGNAGLRGVVTGTRPCRMTIDDERLEPLWAALAEGDVPVLVHPHYGSAMDELIGLGHGGPVGLGFPFETTIAIARMALTGVMERHPTLRIVASHGGGTLPFLAGRLDAAWRSDSTLQQRSKQLPSEQLARLFLDAVLYHPRALRATADLVGTDRLGFGTDHPFTVADPVRNLAAIREVFEGEERRSVLGAAGEAWFGLGPAGE